MMNVQPMGNRILVRRRPKKTMTDGGIALPDNAQERPLLADVLAVGQGKRGEDGKFIPIQLRAGMVVLVNRYNIHGTSLVDLPGEEDLVIANMEDVLARVEEE